MKIRTRFAPSPTGTPESIHLGFIIRALWSYAFAKKNNGEFILRIEDTDQKRSNLHTEQAIYENLKTFNITWDEGPDIGGPHAPYKQSLRLPKYQAAAHKLVSLGYAYYDFDAIKKEKDEIKAQYLDESKLELIKKRPTARDLDPNIAKQRVDNGDPFVVRAKIPENKLFKYNDWILKKEVKILGKEIPDLILLKSDGFPTYHLAVVVDDIDMEISHVFRGQEWISTTPLHLFLYEAFSVIPPNIGHFTVIIDPRTNKKFSKRDASGLFGVNYWLRSGYMEEAILNYLMLLGWAPKDNKELFTMSEFIDAFDQNGVQKTNPVFNQKKIDWFAGTYIRALSLEELYSRFLNWSKKYSSNHIIEEYVLNESFQNKIKEGLKYIQERCINFSTLEKDLLKLFRIEGYQNLNKIKGLADKDKKDIIDSLKYLEQILNVEDKNIWEKSIRDTAHKFEFKDADMFMCLRYALWGDQFSPPLFEICQILGITECKKRIQFAITHIEL